MKMFWPLMLAAHNLLAQDIPSLGFERMQASALERRVVIPSGLSGLSNPFLRGGNTVAEVMPSVPEDTLLYLHNGCGFIIDKFEFGAWVLPGLPFPPGRGALIHNPGPPFELTFSGSAPEPVAVPPLQPGWNLMSLVGSTFNNLQPQEEDLILRWDADRFRGHRYEFGEWFPAVELHPGEAFFYWRPPFPSNCPGFQDPELYFDNRVRALGVDMRISGPDGLPLQDPLWKAQLYVASDRIDFFPVGAPASFRTGAAAGYVVTSAESVVKIPGIVAGAPIFTQVRAWDTRIGPTFEAAFATGQGFFTLPVYQTTSALLAPGLAFPGRIADTLPFGVPLTPVLHLAIERQETNFTVVVQLTGRTAPFVLETSLDLQHWSELAEVASPQFFERVNVVNVSPASRQAFYRARLRFSGEARAEPGPALGLGISQKP